MTLRLGSLFSGYGGLDLAVHQVFGDVETVWVSDIEPGPRKVLAHRFPDVPNLGDITTVDWSQVEPVDIIAGGSPCTDISSAGRMAGMYEGTRSNLWVCMRDAIEYLQPAVVVWENVRGASSARAASAMESDPRLLGDHPAGVPVLRALGRVLGDLASLGFDAEWHSLRAADIGAPHGRARYFVVAANTAHVGHERPWPSRVGWAGPPDGGIGPVALLPTPKASNNENRQSLDRYGMNLGQALWFTPLLPTPRATDGTKGGPNQRGSSGDLMLPSAVMQLLPTPSAGNFNDGEDPEQWEARRQRVRETAKNGNGMGMPLGIAVQLLPTRATRGDSNTETVKLLPTPDANLGNGGRQRSAEALARGDHQTNLSDLPRLLPTPSVADSTGGHERRGGKRGDELLLKGIASHQAWGPYTAAITRWEAVHGPAPAPTKPGRNGRPKLNPEFASWMMGVPAGWITEVPGVTDNEALKMAGNGVVPQQAVAALRTCLAHLEALGGAA